MSSLTKSLEKRIQELKSSINLQQAELGAYEKVLEIELANPAGSHQLGVPNGVDAKAQPTHTQSRRDRPAADETVTAPTTTTDKDPAFSGSKIGFVAKLLEARGTSGATAQEIDEVFSARGIARSENLIYNAFSLMRKERKLEKKNGRYYFVSSDSAHKPVAPTKHRISAEGIKRIREANKKRWAEKRGARNGGTKSMSKKSAQRSATGSVKTRR